MDRKDTDKFLSFLNGDANFKFGNNSLVEGHESIKETISGFFGLIKGLNHTITRIWDNGDTIICKGKVIYTRINDSQLIVPFANTFEIRDGKIQDYQIFVDASELFK